jgi:hypothetical protein
MVRTGLAKAGVRQGTEGRAMVHEAAGSEGGNAGRVEMLSEKCCRVDDAGDGGHSVWGWMSATIGVASAWPVVRIVDLPEQAALGRGPAHETWLRR